MARQTHGVVNCERMVLVLSRFLFLLQATSKQCWMRLCSEPQMPVSTSSWQQGTMTRMPAKSALLQSLVRSQVRSAGWSLSI